MLIQSTDKEFHSFYLNTHFLLSSSFSSFSFILRRFIMPCSTHTNITTHTKGLPPESQLLAETNTPFTSHYASLCIMSPNLTHTRCHPKMERSLPDNHIKPAPSPTSTILTYTNTHTQAQSHFSEERSGRGPSHGSDVLSLPGSHSETLELPALQRHANDIW